MIRLSLKQFALASGATAKWVLNARPRLGQSLEYTERDARWLRLARALNRDVGIPLRTAAALARRVLVGSSAEDPSSEQAPGGGAPTQVTLADRTAADRTAANCADTSASASGSRRRSTRKPAVGSTSTRTANSGRSCSRNCRTVAEYKGAECKGTKRKGAEREGAECKGTSHEGTTITARSGGAPKAGARTRDPRAPTGYSGVTRSPRIGSGRRRRLAMVTIESEGIKLTIDLQRFDSTFAAALAAALAFGENRRAGRKRRAPAHTGAALGQAWRLGIQLGPLRSRARYAAMAEVHPRSRARARMRRSPSAPLLASVSPDTIERQQVNLSSVLQLPQAKAGVDISRALVGYGVRFVLAGEAAEVNRGATPIADTSGSKPALELCYASTVANTRRLSTALRGLGARPDVPARMAAGCDAGIFDPINTTTVDPVTLHSATALAFATPHGTIHVRREVAGIGGFSAARRRATCVRTYGCELEVLDLPALAAARTASGTCGDIARLPVLETLRALPALEARRRELALRRTELSVASPSTHDDSCPKTPRRPRSPSSASIRGSPRP